MSGVHGATQSTRHTHSVVASSSMRSFSLAGGSKVLGKSVMPTLRQATRVFDGEDNDVTPQPLYHADPGAVQVKGSRFFVEEISVGSAPDHSTAAGSYTVPFSRSVFGSSRICSHSTIESVNQEVEDTFSKRDLQINFPGVFYVADVPVKRERVKEQVTEELLKEVIYVIISETDSISLLDIPCTCLSVDAGDTETIIKRNNHYAEVCRNRMASDKYVDRSTQTLNGALKNKQVQTDAVIMADIAMTVTTSDMYDTLCCHEQHDTMLSLKREERVKIKSPEAIVDISRCAERSMSLGSTASTGSTASSLREVDVFGSTSNAESYLQLIMQSEKFQHSLLEMQRTVLVNTFQSKLAAYRNMPILADPDTLMKSGTMEQREEDTESYEPALERLWAFSCELTKGHSVSSMAWNKKKPDLLAVGYGEFQCSNLKKGLVCCWSLQNPTWPERVVHCDSAVTSLDFSANNPNHLAVGMYDGSITIYNVQTQDHNSYLMTSNKCPNRHLGPVWQLRWIQQELSLTREENLEALVSVSDDGRISRWHIFNNGLDCIDLMKLKRIPNTKKTIGRNNTTKKTESVLSSLTRGLCFDFHPTDSSIFLAGTWDGLIHKCSTSNSQQFLETFRKHFCPVNCVSWCPLSRDVFLSCSSDWTIQLWKQGHIHSVLGFSSIQRTVCDVKWSPSHATVFGAISERALEIWDLNSSILDPVAVQSAEPSVMMKSLLFATQTDCVLVGDSDGQVTVYKLGNLSLAERNQVDILQGLIHSAVSTKI